MTSLNLGQVSVASAGLTTATTAYTDGDTLGTILTFAPSGSPAGLIITGAELVDAANIIGAVDLFLWDRSVTQAADNAAGPAVSDADALFTQGVIEFPYPKLAGNNRIATLDSLARQIKPNVAGTGFFGTLVTRSGHTFFGAVGNLQVILHYTTDS
jgi:hypothetical protein